jgi:hypothetical protein
MIRFHGERSMRTENCTEIADAQRIELKSGLTEPGEHHRHRGFIIPAGILIGLGLGILAGYAFPGFLIGLGLGLIGSELLPRFMRSLGSDPGNGNMTTLLIGAFLVFIGIGTVWAPAAIWPYAIAGFFILAGVWLLVRGFSHTA